jgi:regulator of replication initiation timing
MQNLRQIRMTNEHDESLRPLKRTRESLDQISACLSPFVSLLDRYNRSVGRRNDKSLEFDKRKIAEAKMAIALSMGTLRYMAAKLQGNKVEKSDPLRIELDKLRKVLVEFNALHKNEEKNEKKDAREESTPKRNKRNRVTAEPSSLDGIRAKKTKTL